MSARRLALVLAAGAAFVTAVAPQTAAAEPTAEHDYLLSCAGCHKLDGTGSATVPTLVGVDALLTRAGGRDYLLRVPGVAQAPLSDARLAALLNWVLGHFGAAGPTPPFTAAEVARTRTQPLADPRHARAGLSISAPSARRAPRADAPMALGARSEFGRLASP